MAKQFKFDGLIKQAEIQKAAAEQATTVSKADDNEIKKNIIIRDEFKFLIPPPAEDEFAKLEENIIAEGCRDPLVLWKDGNEYVLIDGHNRYMICRTHNIDFKITILDFPSNEAVVDWMVNNQLGKRNATEETKSYLRGMQYNREKRKVGDNQYSPDRVGQSDLPQSTAERLAQIHKVSEKTIKRDEKYAIAVDKLSGGDKVLKFEILNRTINLPKTAVMNLADEDPEIMKRIGSAVQSGLSLSQAIRQIKPYDTEERINIPNHLLQLRQEIVKNIEECLQYRRPENLKHLQALVQKLIDELS